MQIYTIHLRRVDTASVKGDPASQTSMSHLKGMTNLQIRMT